MYGVDVGKCDLFCRLQRICRSACRPGPVLLTSGTGSAQWAAWHPLHLRPMLIYHRVSIVEPCSRRLYLVLRCVWWLFFLLYCKIGDLCILWFGVQTGNDVRESGDGATSMTSHCCVWLCDRWLKNSRHQTSGAKVVHFGAFVTVGARRFCPESWLGKGTC